MRAVIQRVNEACVTVDERVTGHIQEGLLILLGMAREDTMAHGHGLAEKLSRLRIFPDQKGVMNRSLLDIEGQALVISQFTLHARTRQGTRPSYHEAARPEQAEPLYEDFAQHLESLLGPGRVARGEFGAMMQVSLVNDGPVTLIFDTADASRSGLSAP